MKNLKEQPLLIFLYVLCVTLFNQETTSEFTKSLFKYHCMLHWNVQYFHLLVYNLVVVKSTILNPLAAVYAGYFRHKYKLPDAYSAGYFRHISSDTFWLISRPNINQFSQFKVLHNHNNVGQRNKNIKK